MDTGGLAAVSWVTPGGMSRGLVNGGSTGEGLRLMVRERCAQRLAPRTTWVALPTIHLVWASSASLFVDARGRLLMIWRLRDDANIRCDGPQSPLVPNFVRPAGYFIVSFTGDAAIAAQFRQVLLISPPALALGTGEDATRPLLPATYNVRSNGTLRRSSAGSQVPFLSFVGILCSSTMSDNADGTALLFSVARGNLLEILDEALSTMVATETLGVTV